MIAKYYHSRIRLYTKYGIYFYLCLVLLFKKNFLDFAQILKLMYLIDLIEKYRILTGKLMNYKYSPLPVVQNSKLCYIYIYLLIWNMPSHKYPICSMPNKQWFIKLFSLFKRDLELNLVNPTNRSTTGVPSI